MKKCPFCAEEIQNDAIKCKHCSEFLEEFPNLRADKDKAPWYFRTTFIVLALFMVGPLALPLIWWRPRTSPAWKIGFTIGILAITWILYLLSLQSLRAIQEYYRLIESL